MVVASEKPMSFSILLLNWWQDFFIYVCCMINKLLPVFRLHQLKTFQLNQVITAIFGVLWLVELLLFLLILFASPTDLSLTIGMLMVFGFMGVQLIRFRKGYWWSWCVLFVISMGMLFMQAVSFAVVIYQEKTFTIQFIFALLTLFQLLLMTHYRILGFHGIRKQTYYIALSLGIFLGIVLVTFLVF